MRILVVDDDPSSASLLIRYLNDVGDCDLAMNGREAVRLFQKSFKENYPFDLVCLDIMMPKGDGHETLTAIRKIEEEEGIQIGEGSKVLMVSALDDSDTILKSFMELCDGYLAKPIKKKLLFAKLREIELLSENDI